MAARVPSGLRCGLVRILLASVAFSTADARALSWDTRPTAVVASLHERVGEIEHPDPGPWVQVFGDGRVAVHVPPYMRPAGDWTGRLDAAELGRLLGTLAGSGLLDLDAPAARTMLERRRAAHRAAALRGEATVFEASDPSITTITLRVEGRERTIVWRGLRADAHAHPDVAEVRELRRAHETLRELIGRPGLQRVR